MPPRPPKIPESVLVVIHTPALEQQHVDEPLAETCRREVAEETGIVVDDAQLADWQLANVYEIYPVWRHRYADGVTHNTEHVFGLVVPAGTAVRVAPREHLNFAWLPWREAADRCFSPSNAEAILQLPQRMPPQRDRHLPT